MMPEESVVLCEGYHDRAFWSGILLQLACTDARDKGNGMLVPVRDPYGDPVSRGQFAFLSFSGKFIRITPVNGKANILPVLKNRLAERQTKPFANLVLNVDSDLNADGTKSTARFLSDQSVLEQVRAFDPAAQISANGEIKIDGGRATIFLVSWMTNDPTTRGIPNQQTLERVLCAFLVMTYPHWGNAVHDWLDSRPDKRSNGPKSFAWSYLAGWFADETSGYESFCKMIWEKSDLAGQLRRRLIDCGAWRVAEILAS